MTLVALAGGSGKLGRIIRSVIDEAPDFDVTTVLGSASEPADIAGVDLVVDATTLEASEKIVREAIARGIPALVATSGWSAEKIAEIAPLAEAAGVAVVIIPNFSLGSRESPPRPRSSFPSPRSSSRTATRRSTRRAAPPCAPPS
jgi:4-hydroxy-tetrahydrodipicolinate reductase